VTVFNTSLDPTSPCVLPYHSLARGKIHVSPGWSTVKHTVLTVFDQVWPSQTGLPAVD